MFDCSFCRNETALNKIEENDCCRIDIHYENLDINPKDVSQNLAKQDAAVFFY